MRKLLVLIAVLVLPLPAAQGHTALLSSNLQSDSSFQELPQTISLIFNEDLMTISGKEINSLTLVAPDKSELTVEGISIVGAQLSAPLPTVDFMAGVYSLKYRIVSADGHPVEGSFTFTYLDPSPAPTTSSAPDETGESNKILFLALGIGALLVILIALTKLRKKKS